MKHVLSKIVSLVTAAVLLLSLVPYGAASATMPELRLDAGEVKDKTINVSVKCRENCDILKEAVLELEYDPAIFSLIAVEKGEAIASAEGAEVSFTEPSTGSLEITVSLENPLEPSAQVAELIAIRFGIIQQVNHGTEMKLTGKARCFDTFLFDIPEYRVYIILVKPEGPEYQPLQLNVAVPVEPAAGETAYFRFVPESSWTYRFFSVGGSDASVRLYNGSHSLYRTGDAGEDGNFEIEAPLSAGTTYYFEVTGSGADTFSVTLEHAHTVYAGTTIVPATCAAEGTVRKKCNVCGLEWEEPIERLPHTDADENGVCDVCGGRIRLLGEGRLENDGTNDLNWSLTDDGTLVLSGAKEIRSLQGLPHSTMVRRVRIGEGVERVGERAFVYRSQLVAVVLPDSLREIGNFAFDGCRGLETVAFGSGLQEIGVCAFFSCENLEKVSFGKNLESIGRQAFDLCAALETIDFPDSLLQVGEYAFAGTKWMSDRPEGLIYAGNVLLGKKGDMGDRLNVKPGTRAIAKNAFYGIGDLLTVDLPEGLLLIDNCAFCRTKVGTLTLPKSVQRIGKGAFYQGGFASADPVEKVVYGGTKADWDQLVIEEDNERLLNAKEIVFAEGQTPAPAPVINTETAKEQDGSVFAAPALTAAQLLALAGNGASLTDKNGKAVGAADRVGSGMVLTRPDGSKETVVVKGDNDGDGKISAADARFALRTAVRLESPNDWQTKASRIESKEKISSADARAILRASVNLQKLPLT